MVAVQLLGVLLTIALFLLAVQGPAGIGRRDGAPTRHRLLGGRSRAAVTAATPARRPGGCGCASRSASSCGRGASSSARSPISSTSSRSLAASRSGRGRPAGSGRRSSSGGPAGVAPDRRRRAPDHRRHPSGHLPPARCRASGTASIPSGLLDVTISLVVLFLLVANGLRRGYRWAWWFAVILCSLFVLLAVLILAVAVILLFAPDTEDLDIERWTTPVHRRLAAVPGVPGSADRRTRRVPGAPTQQAAAGLGHLARGHREGPAAPVGRRHHLLDDHLAGEPAHDHRRRPGYLAFRKHAGSRSPLGDPIGPPGSTAGILNDFVALCDKAALVPYIFCCAGRPPS